MEHTLMEKHKVLNQIEKDLKQLSSIRHGRRAFLISLPVILGGCANVAKTRYREGDNKGQTGLSVKEEIRMTREYLP